MKHHRSVIGFVTVLAVTLLVASLGAQEKPEMSPEAIAEMEAWMKAGTPNEHHQRLATFAGDWNVTSTFWAGPGAPAQESKGKSMMKMVMGGRYLMEKASMQWMDQPFEGMGFIGYDNLQKKYVSSWIDNMSTGIMVSEGSWNEGDKSYTWTGSYVDALTGEEKTMRSVTKIVSADEHVIEFYDTEDGKEYKSMKLIYTR